MPETLDRRDCLSLIGFIDNRHSLRILPDGSLGLCADPRNLRGQHRHVSVLAAEEPTRRRAIQLALKVTGSHQGLSRGLLRVVHTKLGDTALASLGIAAAHVATWALLSPQMMGRGSSRPGKILLKLTLVYEGPVSIPEACEITLLHHPRNLIFAFVGHLNQRDKVTELRVQYAAEKLLVELFEHRLTVMFASNHHFTRVQPRHTYRMARRILQAAETEGEPQSKLTRLNLR